LLAISGPNRSKRAPGVPTFAEAGLPDYEASTWSSIVVPARTPQAIVDRLNAALNKALADPGTLQRLDEGEALSLGPSTPAAATAFSRKERAHWVPLIRSLKLNPD
jgi:tripartite-type tricarboxylate transporter receptor subunit TctC